MPKVLTAKSVEQIKPGKARREINDGGSKGLYLYVQPTGAKTWVVLLGGRKLHLGPVDLSGRNTQAEPKVGTPMGLADARWLAAELQRQRAAGRDVIAEQRAKPEPASTKFPAVAKQFIDEYAKVHTRRWKETAHILGLDYNGERMEGGLAERWDDRDITAITSDDLYRLVDEARRRGIPGLPSRTAGISDSRGRAMARALSKLFGWALQHRKITADPSVGVFVPPAPKSRDRVLTDSELVLFWTATDQIGEPFGPMLKLLMLTGARLREVAGMRYSELEDAAWTIPGARTKNHKPLLVPLPPLAIDILSGVKRLEGSDFVFSTTGTSPVSGFSKTKNRLDELMGDIPPWRLHDLRRSAATGMSNLGIAPHVVEAVLNHISGAKAGVAGVYNKSEYAPEKASALERWAKHVAGLVSGKSANVTRLRG